MVETVMGPLTRTMGRTRLIRVSLLVIVRIGAGWIYSIILL